MPWLEKLYGTRLIRPFYFRYDEKNRRKRRNRSAATHSIRQSRLKGTTKNDEDKKDL